MCFCQTFKNAKQPVLSPFLFAFRKMIVGKGDITADEAAALKIAHSEQDDQVGIDNKPLGEITLLIEQDRKTRASPNSSSSRQFKHSKRSPSLDRI